VTGWPSWLDTAEAADLPDLPRLRGRTALNLAAVTNGLTLPLSRALSKAAVCEVAGNMNVILDLPQLAASTAARLHGR